MKLYITPLSPDARITRIVSLEKGLEDRVEVIEEKTRVAGSPYYAINPSGRVPYLVRDDGIGERFPADNFGDAFNQHRGYGRVRATNSLSRPAEKDDGRLSFALRRQERERRCQARRPWRAPVLPRATR